MDHDGIELMFLICFPSSEQAGSGRTQVPTLEPYHLNHPGFHAGNLREYHKSDRGSPFVPIRSVHVPDTMKTHTNLIPFTGIYLTPLEWLRQSSGRPVATRVDVSANLPRRHSSDQSILSLCLTSFLLSMERGIG